ncbi:PilN domain-containing protein [Kineococcus auxinigenes]|uniref:PilN domain-containing protein n=1 Tax=unclassified Kineococcus TaxID=2621656 RepID=UPI003D7C8D76
MSFQTLEAVASRTAVVRVNLLPGEFAEARKAKQLRLALAGSLVVVLGACAGAYGITAGHVAAADEALAAEQARTPALLAEQEPYAEVPTVLKQVEDAVQVREAVAQGDIPWYSYLDQLAAVAPTELSFTSLNLQLTTTADAGASADPLQAAGVARIAVVGETKTQGKVADWLDAVAGVPGVADPRLSSSTLDPSTGVVTFNADMTLTADALLGEQ